MRCSTACWTHQNYTTRRQGCAEEWWDYEVAFCSMRGARLMQAGALCISLPTGCSSRRALVTQGLAWNGRLCMATASWRQAMSSDCAIPLRSSRQNPPPRGHDSPWCWIWKWFWPLRWRKILMTNMDYSLFNTKGSKRRRRPPIWAIVLCIAIILYLLFN